jgi:probable phosphoglycerate mutase
MRHPEVAVDVLMSSAFPRARETAQIIAPAIGSMGVDIDPLWGEHDPGPECDGLSYADFIERHGMPNWEGDPHGVTFPGGETVAEFHHRIGIALHRTVRNNEGKTVVVCCHGGVVDAVLRMSLRSSLTGGFEVHTMNTSVTEMVEVRPGRWRLVRYNDHAHLAGLPSSTSSEIATQQQSAG